MCLLALVPLGATTCRVLVTCVMTVLYVCATANREVYPGVYLGKMYAMPGTRMYGVLNVPADSAPVRVWARGGWGLRARFKINHI